MKMYDLSGMISSPGEYLIGSQQTGSHACYLIYGRLAPGERGRRVMPGNGHEELVMAVRGDLGISGGGILQEGRVLHLIGEEACEIENTGAQEAVYIIAGGHSGHGHD